MATEKDLHDRFLTHVSKKVKSFNTIFCYKYHYGYIAKISFVFNKTPVPIINFMYFNYNNTNGTLNDILFFTFNEEKLRIGINFAANIINTTDNLLSEEKIQSILIDENPPHFLSKKKRKTRKEYFMIEENFYSFIDNYYQIDLRPYNTFDEIKNTFNFIDQWRRF